MVGSIDLDSFIKKHMKLNRVLNNRRVKYSVDEITDLVKSSIIHLESQPKIPRISPSVVIVGDIHGQYLDLLRMFALFDSPTKNGYAAERYLFLGDYVDRGSRSLECISLLLALQLRYPKQFVLLRGNHETISINHIYGFHQEMLTRFPKEGEDLWLLFNSMFCYMPLAGMVGKKILCMHGGISKELNSLADIEMLPRPLDDPSQHKLATDLLWADPKPDINGFAPNTVRHVSTFFGEDAVVNVCKKMDIDLIVRAHQMLLAGFGFFANRSLVTVFTATQYQGDNNNSGAVMYISRNGNYFFPDGRILGKPVPHSSEKSKSCKPSFGPDAKPADAARKVGL